MRSRTNILRRRGSWFAPVVLVVAVCLFAVPASASTVTPLVCTGSCPTPTAGQGPLSITVSPGDFAVYKDVVDVSGSLSVCVDGSTPSDDGFGNLICGDGSTPSPNIADPSGQTVELQSAKYPYTDYVALAQTTTDSSGSYDFQVRAGFTVHYRVVIAALGVTSIEVPLIVWPIFKFPGYVDWGSGIFRSHVRIQVPPTVNLGGARVVWYMHDKGQRHWYRIGFSHLKKTGPGKTKTSISKKLPRGEKRTASGVYKACLFNPPATVSIGDPVGANCPTKRMIPLKALGL